MPENPDENLATGPRLDFFRMKTGKFILWCNWKAEISRNSRPSHLYKVIFGGPTTIYSTTMSLKERLKVVHGEWRVKREGCKRTSNHYSPKFLIPNGLKFPIFIGILPHAILKFYQLDLKKPVRSFSLHFLQQAFYISLCVTNSTIYWLECRRLLEPAARIARKELHLRAGHGGFWSSVQT